MIFGQTQNLAQSNAQKEQRISELMEHREFLTQKIKALSQENHDLLEENAALKDNIRELENELDEIEIDR